MIIDFHAHIYPEKIAEKAANAIGTFYNAPMCYNGTSQKLLESGSKINVTNYVVHSAATGAAQVESINNFIISEVSQHKEFIGFGTMHPDYDNFEAELKRIKEAGLKGIKLHADFQKFKMDEERMDPIYELCTSLGLIVLVHAGDYRFDYTGPKRLLNLHEKHPEMKFVAAHFGGYTQWDEAFEYLAGKNIYFDTSSTLWKLPLAKAMEMIKKHGTDKFLFGSDYPMWDHAEELARFDTLKLSSKEKEDILYNNAKCLLNL